MKKAILLGGGTGERLRPFTTYTSKHLVNVAGKPVIDYPIKTLQQMGITDLAIVVGSSFSGQILDYVRDGARYGIDISYRFQDSANGIAAATNLCKSFVQNEDFILILGDNFFEKPIVWKDVPGAQIVLHKHPDLQRFGVASIKDNKIERIEEKPQTIYYKYENYAITGCYKFTSKFFDYFKEIKPSKRGEFEITHIIEKYHQDNNLSWTIVDGVWSDLGTFESIGFVGDYLYNKNR